MASKIEMIHVTAFGSVKLGPKFLRFMAEAQSDLATKSKRSKDYKYAKERMRRMGEAIETLSEIEWVAGGVLDRTP